MFGALYFAEAYFAGALESSSPAPGGVGDVDQLIRIGLIADIQVGSGGINATIGFI